MSIRRFFLSAFKLARGTAVAEIIGITTAGPLGRLFTTNYGRTNKYEHKIIGYNQRVSSLRAAMLSVNLRHLDTWTEARRRLAARDGALVGRAFRLDFAEAA
jgi:dTDP-4-amino-4,6-dideoxygalactose transaminase